VERDTRSKCALNLKQRATMCLFAGFSVSSGVAPDYEDTSTLLRIPGNRLVKCGGMRIGHRRQYSRGGLLNMLKAEGRAKLTSRRTNHVT
jgi:hypothetical protein